MVPQVCEAEDVLLRRVRDEYLEMPDLRLNLAQAQRLWGLDAVTCRSVLRKLVEVKFLWCAPDGTLVRFDSETPGR